MSYVHYPPIFRPSAPSDLIRVGPEHDGGYVLPERIVGASSGLVSFGLSDEWSFEEDFCRRARVSVVCFDPTVASSFWLRRFLACTVRGLAAADYYTLRRAFRFIDYRLFFSGRGHIHVRQPIGYKTAGALSLVDALGLTPFKAPVFLKMDIEGWEYRVLDEIVGCSDRFTGLAIEFHDIDLHEARIAAFVKAVQDAFVLVHFHPNTQTLFGPEGRALAVEMTFMHRSLLLPGEQLATLPLPIKGLDSPNFANDEEPQIGFDTA